MAMDLEIAPGRKIGVTHPCFIIAEVGQNHQGDIEVAKLLIRAAKENGADCVKFQKTCLKEKFNSAALARQYPGPNSWGETYGQHKQYLEFSQQQFKELQTFATKEVGIIFTASAMDEVSVDTLDFLNVPFLKIGSGDANNFPMLEYAASKNRPMVISTGMQSINTIRQIYQIVKAINLKFCLLHCVSAYPSPPADINLRVIQEYKAEFPDIHIGYSGHESGIAISIGAVAMGAKILERHITLDNSWKGSDHICSLLPHELRDLVLQVRTVEAALGSPTKRMQPSERACYDKLGKTLVAACKLRAGDTLDKASIKVKVAEPKGWPAEQIYSILGRTLNTDVEEDDSILQTYII